VSRRVASALASLRSSGALALLASAGALASLAACERYETLTVLPPASLRTHYLVDLAYEQDPTTRFATEGHLVVFNPGARPADLDVTVYFEEREPAHFRLAARAGASTESGFDDWPVHPGDRFALAVTSSEPVIAQATTGWNNVGNDAAATARAPDGGRPREAATSYMAIPSLATRWYLPDGIVIDDARALWIRESEWAVLLNPGDAPAHVDLALFFKVFTRSHAVEVPARRIRAFRMDDLVTLRNKHYGVRMASDVPIAAQWRRTIEWYDSPELMSFWSEPCVPLDLAVGDPTADAR
jgi:hypothetical protein